MLCLIAAMSIDFKVDRRTAEDGHAPTWLSNLQDLDAWDSGTLDRARGRDTSGGSFTISEEKLPCR